MHATYFDYKKMEFKDYYKILGVKPDADLKQIKIAYRKLAKTYHPDVSDHDDAEAKFKEISEAYRVLKSAEKRSEYDEIRRYNIDGQTFRAPPGWQASAANQQSVNPDDFSDFFSSIFGENYEHFSAENLHTGQQQYHRRRQSPQQRGQDIQTDMPVFLEETLQDELKSISYHLAGVDKKLKVKIPAGVMDGEIIRLKGQGAPGYGGGQNGDLYIRIKLIPHPLFDVEGHNLVITLPLAPWEAALGTRVELPTLGGKVKLSIPANSQNGQRLRVKGKGMMDKAGVAGDLFAVIKIVVPAKWDESERQHLQKLAQHSTFDPRAQWSKYQ